MPPLQGQWLEALKPEFKKAYYKELFDKVGQEYKTRKIFPAPDDIFNAFHFTPLGPGESCDFRTGSLSQRRTGTRSLLFRKAGGGYPPLSGKYLSGAS